MKYTRLFFASIFFALFASCAPDTFVPEWPDEWQKPEKPDEPDNPDNPDNPDDPEKPFIGKARYVWIDAGANFNDYANDAAKIKSDVKRLKETGFTDLIVDVRPTNGGVLFKSDNVPALTRVDAWVTGGYVWLQRTATFDYLQAFIDAAHEEGLRVNASVNTMVGGCLCPYGLGSDGMLFEDSAKKAWATVVNTADGLVNTMDQLDDSKDYGAKFLNPANDEVQAYLLDMLADLAEYDLDGIILDRCRYSDDGLMSDFSDISRTKFEEYIGTDVANWPADVMAPGQDEFSGYKATVLQKQWLEFRAKTIHDFVEKASAKVHGVNPDIRFGCYVGGWYSSYYTSGVNWASPEFSPSGFWVGNRYKEFGYADHCDFMFIGAYAASDKIYGSTEWTMQGFCKQAANKLKGVPFSGGPDIGNSIGFTDGNAGHLMPDIVDACINSSTDGMFFFDLCHIKKFNYWDDIKNAIDKYLLTVE